LYTGFDWGDTGGAYHHSTVWKSTNSGGSWAETNTNVVGGYCNQSPSSEDSQCYYDNVIGVDPDDSDIVYALGLFSYDFAGGNGAGGVYRSMDGGQTWVDLGW